MKLIKADQGRRIEIPGVAEPVRKPVDVDRIQTGFTALRSLRIYRFDAGSVIDGHAEEDEVLIVVLAGSVEFTLTDPRIQTEGERVNLAAAGTTEEGLCAAYLPPDGAYRLVVHTEAEVAYARATPQEGPPTRVFPGRSSVEHQGIGLLWSEEHYPRLLRARLVRITGLQETDPCAGLVPAEGAGDTLLFFKTEPPSGAVSITAQGEDPVLPESWDCVALSSGEPARITVQRAAQILMLVVVAAK